MHDHLAHPGLPPGPNRSPLRNLYLWTTDLNGTLASARAEFGDVFTMRLYGMRPMVCFATSDAAREIMQESGARLGASNDVVQAIVGRDNVLMKNGVPHTLHRRRLMPALTGDALFAHAGSIRSVLDAGLDALECGERVAIVPWARRVTLAVIQRCLFGMADGDEAQALADDVIRLSEEGQRPAALMASLVAPPEWLEAITRGRFDADGTRLPDPLPIRAMLRHPLVSANRRVQDRLLAHVRGVRIGSIEVVPTSMLAMLLGLAERQGTEVPDRALVDDLVTLLIAGHDTTAVSFAWLALHLGRSPAVVAALRNELADAGGAGSIDPARLGRLPYLDAVVREGMRVNSIAAGFARTTLEPITIAGVDLPAGVIAAAFGIGAHYESGTYDDPGRFDPQNMLARRIPPENWFPFGAGYRRCVGAFFATLELKLLVSSFVERVSFESVHRDGPVGLGARGIISEPIDRGLLRIEAIRPRDSAARAAGGSVHPAHEAP